MTKELEAFYELGDNTPITDNWKIVENALKVLEIIEEKMVNVADLIDCFVLEQDLGYHHYNRYHDNYSYKLLSREEFDTLIEFFKNHRY